MNNKFDLVFVVTCTDLNNVNNLLNSICHYNRYIKVGLVLLVQNGLELSIEVSNGFLKVYKLCTDKKHSLSQARNICLDFYKSSQIDSRYIMFPDDDTTFDESFFKNFSGIVTSNMLIDVLCEGTRIPYISFSGLENGDYTTCHKHAMSVNMIIKSDNVLEIGGFDELLGVGAKYGAGEDGDYFIRLCNRFGPFVYTDQLWNYHPSADDKYRKISFSRLLRRYKTYGEGVIYLLVKHKIYFEAVKCIFSGFAGALIALFFKFNIKLSIARFYGGIIRLNIFCKFLLNKSLVSGKKS